MRTLARDHVNEAVVAAFFVAAAIDAATTEQASKPAALAFAAAWTLPLLARTRAPEAATLFVFLSLAVESRVLQPATEAIVILPVVVLAFWTAGRIESSTRALAVGLVGGACAFIVVASDPGPMDASSVVFASVLSAAPFLAGSALASRERRLVESERDRGRRAADAVAAERQRIARELHDVVGHAISVMTAQTGAARMLLDQDPATARAALDVVDEAGREALADMRRMLAVLRDGDAPPALGPQPGLGDLDVLIARARDSGLPVEVAVEGAARPLSPGIELAVYRIVQESLTNARKHARGARAWVRLRYAGDELAVVVENDGCDGVPERVADGHGLIGMRERTAVYGGALEAGPVADGRFAVRATLPLGEAR